MKPKTFKIIQLIVVVVLAIVFGQAVVMRNFIVPIVAASAAIALLLFLRGRVKGVIADERDWGNGGKGALLALQVYSWFAVVVMIVLLTLREKNPMFEAVSATLAYSTCTLMLLYAVFFKIMNRRGK